MNIYRSSHRSRSDVGGSAEATSRMCDPCGSMQEKSITSLSVDLQLWQDTHTDLFGRGHENKEGMIC
jgi:hypothetical protein